MSISVDRVVGTLNSHLICPICLGILQEPLQDKNEHAFCQTCIHKWLEKSGECPVDRTPLSRVDLKPVSRLLQNLLSEIEIYCEYRSTGCNAILKLSHVQAHATVCEHNPDKPILCSNGCGALVPRQQFSTHNCIKKLRSETQELAQLVQYSVQQFKVEIKQIQTKISEMTSMVSVLYRDDLFRTKYSEFLKNLSGCSKGYLKDVTQICEDYECEAHVKENLSQLKCPQELIEQICRNSKETHWPGPLSYSTSRKIHETQIKTLFGFDIAKTGYVMLILPHLNRHLPAHFTKEPGIILKLLSYESMIRI